MRRKPAVYWRGPWCWEGFPARTRRDRRAWTGRPCATGSHRYNEAGLSGLRARKPEGRPPKLTATQITELRDLGAAGPDPERHQVIRWRCIDLCGEVARRFAVEVPERTIAKWLRKLDLTRLRPHPYHPKKDAAARATFKLNFTLFLDQPTDRKPTR